MESQTGAQRHLQVFLTSSVSHPQCVVDGVLLLILGHHQRKGVRPGAGQPHLGQVMGAVDADAVDVGRGVGCGGSREQSLLLSGPLKLSPACYSEGSMRPYRGNKPSSRLSCKRRG